MSKLFLAGAALVLCAALIAGTPATGQAASQPKVKIETSMGDIVVELDSARAPKTVSNFLFYVKSGFYEGTVFHRVIENFMIQGGGHTADMTEKTTTRKPVDNEAANGLKNDAYTIAMARTSHPNSATAQFFINVKDNSFLNHKDNSAAGYGYAVFGKVISGKDTVDRIKRVPTERVAPYDDVPRTPVVINNITPILD